MHPLANLIAKRQRPIQNTNRFIDRIRSSFSSRTIKYNHSITSNSTTSGYSSTTQGARALGLGILSIFAPFLCASTIRLTPSPGSIFYITLLSSSWLPRHRILPIPPSDRMSPSIPTTSTKASSPSHHPAIPPQNNIGGSRLARSYPPSSRIDAMRNLIHFIGHHSLPATLGQHFVQRHQ